MELEVNYTDKVGYLSLIITVIAEAVAFYYVVDLFFNILYGK